MDILKNIKSIRLEKGINQEILADALEMETSSYSRIENGITELKVNQLAKIADVLQIKIIDIITYPKVFVDKFTIENSERISVTFEVSPDKKDILLNLVTKSDNNLEIFKK